jgi:hypothetical protein
MSYVIVRQTQLLPKPHFESSMLTAAAVAPRALPIFGLREMAGSSATTRNEHWTSSSKLILARSAFGS